MRRFLVIAAIVLGLLAIAVSIFVLRNPNGAETAATETWSSATITDRGITPPTVTVKKGSSVTWTNQDNVPHTLTITSPNPPQELKGFGSDEPMAKGETYSFTFDAAGTFTYADPATPDKVQGKVIVE